MTRFGRPLLLLLVLAAAAFSCRGGPASVLDEGPRVPDDAGVVTDVTLDRIQLDGSRTYEIGTDVESFTTRSHEATPLLAWNGRYVHVGLVGDRVRWIAGIGLVSGDPPVVVYSGILSNFDAGASQAVFGDGTVLSLDPALDPPQPGREIVVEIDAEGGTVVRLLN